MKLKQSLLITFILSLVAIVAWEAYWRSQGYTPTLNDEKALWAKERAKLENATEKDVVIIGASELISIFRKMFGNKKQVLDPFNCHQQVLPHFLLFMILLKTLTLKGR